MVEIDDANENNFVTRLMKANSCTLEYDSACCVVVVVVAVVLWVCSFVALFLVVVVFSVCLFFVFVLVFSDSFFWCVLLFCFVCLLLLE